MSDNTTQARPYANAAFMFALETTTSNALSMWSQRLHMLSMIVSDPDAEYFISNPSVSTALQVDLVLSTAKNLGANMSDESLARWVELLAENKRLLLLPAIAAYFDELRAEHEKTLTVSVVSFTALSDAQQQLLIQKLSQRLQRQVTLSISLDPTLLGGAIIYAGDWVLDSTVRGKLAKLGALLAA